MAVNLHPPAALLPVAGVRLGCAEAAIKKAGRKDLLLVALAEGTQVAGVFTRNAFAAAPVLVCRRHLAGNAPVRALVFNAGNANAGTGEAGLRDALEICAAAGAVLGVPEAAVLPFSTGVIGQRLPVRRMTDAIPAAAAGLDEDGWLTAAKAIMTTDTVPKGSSRRVATAEGEVTVTGIAKGVGMICPDMATLLAMVATDARLAPDALRSSLQDAVDQSFNCVTVDGDTSTNDACVLVATGQAGRTPLGAGHADYPAVADAIRDVCVDLAQAVVRDGEGATRFVTVRVSEARNAAEARQVAYSIAHSPLVKTAWFAGDANWGRLIMAVGKAGVDGLRAEDVNVWVDDVPILERGEPHPAYSEERGAAAFAKTEYAIRVTLGRGTAAAHVWTCDLTYDYVRINAEYRT